MKKKKIFNILLIVTFCLLIFVPVFTYPLLKKYDKLKLNENRTLTSFPKINSQFFSNFDKFFSDHLPFRSYFINSYTAIFNKIDEEYFKFVQKHNIPYYIEKNGVIAGKNGWYFYSAEGSLYDYTGVNLPSLKTLEACAEKVKKIDKYFKSQGKTFVIYVAPNKEEIYSENMPDAIKVKNKIKKTDMFVDYLSKNTNVKIVYPKQTLIEAKSDKFTYYQYDTHWNNYGAYVGTMELLNALNIKSDYEITITDNGRTIGGSDLLNQLNIPSVYENDYKINYRTDINFSIEDIKHMTRRTTSTNKNGKNLLLLGDSFGEFMTQFLSKEFENAYYGKIYDYYEFGQNADEFDKADTIVFEAVGRYDGNVFDAGLNKVINQFNI